MHALIIEDESLIAMLIEDCLGDCGYTSFDYATSADDAISAARDRYPDLITSDVQLKPGSGIDAVRAICLDKNIPVVFITSRAADVRLQSQEHEVLSKPFLAASLADAVMRARPPNPTACFFSG